MKKTLFSLLIAGVIAIGVMLLPGPAMAQTDLFNDVCNGRGAASPVCNETRQSGNPFFGPQGVLTEAISLLSIIVGIAAVIMIILSGLKFITSGSNPQDVTKAREMLLYAVVGIIIAVTAQLIVRVFISRFS